MTNEKYMEFYEGELASQKRDFTRLSRKSLNSASTDQKMPEGTISREGWRVPPTKSPSHKIFGTFESQRVLGLNRDKRPSLQNTELRQINSDEPSLTQNNPREFLSNGSTVY